MQFGISSLVVVFSLLALLIFRSEPLWSQEPGDTNEAPTGHLPQNSPKEIAVGTDKIDDRLITQRLADVFQNFPALANVDIAVKAGVVRLSGQTPDKEAHEQALELAGRVERVVSVTYEIIQKTEVRERLTVVQEKMGSQLNAFVSFLPLLIIALLVFLAFWFLAAFIPRWDRLYEKVTPHAFLQSYSSKLSKVLSYLLASLSCSKSSMRRSCWVQLLVWPA